MRKLLKWVVILGGLLWGSLQGVPSAHAAKINPAVAGAGYTVQMVKPRNQMNTALGYFNLKVQPGEQQRLVVILHNLQAQPQKLTLSVNQAYTNADGVIDYDLATKKPDPTLQVPLKQLFKTPQRSITLPANGTERVGLSYEVPADPFKGTTLGAVYVSQTKPGKKYGKGKITLQNLYAYAISIEMRESLKAIQPTMLMHHVGIGQVDRQNMVTANLQNSKPAVMEKLRTQAAVTKRGSATVLIHQTKQNMAMAPNSNFNYQIPWGKTTLKPGQYTLHLSAQATKGSWHFTKNFTVTQKQLNHLANLAKQPRPNYWLYILLAIVIALLLALVGYLIYKNHKNKQALQAQQK
ncbi:DUF916 and DUF3324 domain-containing protein [Levilactobacillus acidifarinae]|uniref:Cell surface protein n=1 Tax=Levilactobacillus acidifarinae DSM 19394 = JCM 15949 TaxID=1423715 RepID=A0A0R1LJY5_9LACO|nr:DUF916 and DUF3324 domain-containing protein [Levilactobacillus acidifarinae]KRK96127.1 cell surface protein [Levilactobacillus acidifarinae DSM 19394]GEO69490.1 cell surface protein [Levilactobacillus acidifarinae]